MTEGLYACGEGLLRINEIEILSSSLQLTLSTRDDSDRVDGDGAVFDASGDCNGYQENCPES